MASCTFVLSIFLAVSLALALIELHECSAKVVSGYVLRLVICPDHLPNE